MRRLKTLASIGTLAVLMAVSTSTYAGKSSGVTGTLSMMAGDSAARSLSGSIYPAYGDNVMFDVITEGKLSRNGWIYVTVICRQGGNVVYQSSNWNDYAFALEDLPGQGLEWYGDPAECTANLVYRVEKGRQAVIEYLDSTEFDVN